MNAKSLSSVFYLTLTLWIQPVIAGPLEDADKAYKREDYATVLKLLEPLVQEGNPDAKTTVGFMYLHGLGVPQDGARAHSLLLEASQQGEWEAQYSLSAMYFKGIGVKQNAAEGARLERVAERGLGQAQFMLGRIYSQGRDLPPDYVRSYMWYSLAASNIAFGKNLQTASTHERTKFAEVKMTPQQISQAKELTIDWVAAHEKAVADPVYMAK
jgi:TPR repeat protein